MIYLASPYTNRSSAVEDIRYRQVRRATAALLKEGLQVFSPVLYSHPLYVHSPWLTKNMENPWEELWKPLDFAFLRRCDEVWVLMIQGWRHSRGVSDEIAEALRMNMPVCYLKPGELRPQEHPSD